MPSLRRADELRRKDQFLLVCANGKTLATVQGIVHATERDLVSPEQGRGMPEHPVIGLVILLSRAVAVPAMPGWKMSMMMLWAAPGDLFERYV